MKKKSLGARALAFSVPVWVVGTYDRDGRPNVMTASWAGICCSRPPCVGVSLREATWTYSALEERGAFTISIPSERHVREADYFGMVTGRDQDKFETSGLTPVRSELVDAPYVEEFPLVLECRVVRSVKLGLHTWFAGEILDVKADEDVLGPTGFPEVDRVRPIVYGPEVRSYHGIGEGLGRAFSLGKGLAGPR